MMFKQFRRQLLPVCGLFVVAVILFFFLKSAHSQSIPTTSGWYQLPNTSLRTVCPPNGFGGELIRLYCLLQRRNHRLEWRRIRYKPQPPHHLGRRAQ